ncbi:polycystin-1-like [Procambarus clarkii]|uniref:polycystin-1-like n=1 Tax=Procambarus clarkii TaxID=6728 RepID=UPI003742E691
MRQMAYRLPTLLLQLLVAVASASAGVAFIEGGCYKDNIVQPWVTLSGGGYSPEDLSPETCKDFCGRLHFCYCAVDEGQYCYCLQTLGTLVSATGECTAVCADGSECGGLTAGVLTVWQTSVLSGHLNFTLNLNTTVIAVGTNVVLSVYATGAWVTNWGDGAIFVTNGTTHTYNTPGEFTIVAFLEKVPNVWDGVIVTVISKPNATLLCPPYMTVGEPSVCPLVTSSQGVDSVLTATFNEPGVPQTSYRIPAGRTLSYGAILNNLTYYNSEYVNTPTAIMIHTDPVRTGYLTKIRIWAASAGWVVLYALSPTCDTGTYYCSETQLCNADCSPEYFNQTCSSHLCAMQGKCSGPACTEGTVPAWSTMQYRLVHSFYVSTLNVEFSYVLDTTLVEVYDDELLAVGCLDASHCASDPLDIKTRARHPTEDPDLIFSYVDGTTATVVGNITGKLLVNVDVSEHVLVNMSYRVNCSTASSMSSVPTPYTATTAAYSLMGVYNLSYVIVSDLWGAASAWTGKAAVSCQDLVGDPVLEEEVWIPLLINTPFVITFTQGAPLFSSLDWGLGIMYTYYPNATNVDWTLHLNYTKTGNFTFIGNASNAVSWVNYTSLIHVVPVVSNKWNATTLCPCLAVAEGFNISLDLPSAPNPPFSAYIYATYANGMLFPNETLEFGTSGGGGAAQALKKLFHTTILQPGNYTLTFLLRNEVSNTTVTTTVMVEEGLANVSFTTKFILDGVTMPGMGPLNNIFMDNTTIFFTPACLKGFPSVVKWRLTLFPSGQVLYTTANRNQTLTHVFNTSGEYYTVVSGYNPVQGWVNSDPVLMVVLSQLEGFVLNDDGRVIEPNNTKIVNANFTVLPPLSCMLISYCDGCADQTFGYKDMCLARFPTINYGGGPLTNPMSLPRVYTQEGIYTVKGLAWDLRVSYTSELQVVIAVLPCSMPEVEIVDRYKLFSQPQVNQRSMPLVKATKAKIECNGTVPVSRWWNILKVEDTTGLPQKTIQVEGLLSSWNNAQLDLSPLFLDLGLYKLSYWIRLNASKIFPLQREDYTYLKIIPTPLRAVMMGGSVFSVSRGFGQTLDLDPQGLSTDPDNPDDKNFTVTWWCRQVSPVLETFAVTSSGKIAVFNLQLIPAPKTAENLTEGGCFGKGPGTIQYSGGSMTLVTSSFVKASATYEVYVRITKDTREANTSIQVEVTRFPPPSVQVKCVDEKLCMPFNGGLLVNPSSRLALVGACIADCDANMKQEWTIMDMAGNSVVETDTVNAGTVFMTLKTTLDFAANPLFFDINPNVERFRFRLTMTKETLTSGFAEVIVIPNGPPKSGTCSLNTNTLRALLDSTMASCNNWKDPEGIGITAYTFYYREKGQLKTMASSGFNSVNLIFPVGVFDVRCKIEDKFGSYVDVAVGPVNASMISKEEFQSYNPSSVLRNLAAIGDQTTMAMALMAIASVKEHADWLSLSDSSFGNMSDSEVNSRLSEVSNMNKEALDFAADTMDFASLSQLSVGAGVLKSAACGVLTQEKAAFTVDMAFREKSLQFMKKMEAKLKVTPVYSPYDLRPFVTCILDAAVCLLKSMNEVIENPILSPPGDLAKASSLDYETGIDKTRIGFAIPLDAATQMRLNVMEITRQRAKTVVVQLFDVVDSLTTHILTKSVVGDEINELCESGAGLLAQKTSEIMLSDNEFEIRPENSLNASVIFPKTFCPSQIIDKNTDCSQVAGFTAVVWPCLTHVYPESKTYLSKQTTVMTLKVFVGNNNITISNETMPIILSIPRRPETLAQPQPVVGRTRVNSHVPFVYHSFNISSVDSAFTVEISPDGDVPPKLVILIDYLKFPTPSTYDMISFVKNLTRDENGTYSWFVNNIDNKNRTGSVSLALAILTDSATLPKPRSNNTLQREDYSDNFNFNYKFRVITSGCYFYNDTIDIWSGIGMNVVNANTTHTICKTNHLTSFGSGYFHSNDTFNYSYIFAAAGFINNLTVYLVLIFTLVWYILMMIWARFKDRRDVQYRGVTALHDNNVKDKYLYEITFTTGPDKEAGTDSNIKFSISGEYDETDVRTLPPSEGRRYHRYCVDAFVMSTPGPLGNIYNLRIWHDNTGRSPFDSWQLQTVVIRDLQTREKYIIKANTWLAFDRGEKKIDALLEPSDSDAHETFVTDFYNKGNRSVNEDHMWLSIFLRPTGSRFSRKERVSVVALYLYLSMLINAMWYQTCSDTPRTGIFEFSTFTFSYSQITVGLVSGVVSYPVILLLIFIFKRARPLKLKKCRALEAAAKQRRNQQNESGIQIEDDDLLDNYDLMSPQSSENRSKDVSPVICIPWWTRWLAWLVILGGMGACAFFVWSYAIMWGEIKTVKWFSSFVISFFISILCTQWLKVIFATTIGVICCKAKDTLTQDIDCDEELPDLRYDEEWNNVQPMDPSTHKVLGIGGVDASEPEIAALTTRLTKKREMNFVIRDVSMYCIFLVVLFVLVNGQTNYNAFLLQAQMTNTFIRIGDKDFDFSAKVTTRDQFWHWAHNVILQQLRAQRWYNDDPPYGLRGFLDDRANRLLGYGIIRQIRSDPNACRVPYLMRGFIKECSGRQGAIREETRNFCDGWSVLEGASRLCRQDEFRYKTDSELRTFSTQGILSTYGGGGYVISLNSLQVDDAKKLKTMQEMGWIDKYTRAVIVEFSVFNANVNLFATCSIMAEFNEGGGITPNWRFEPVQLLANTGFFGYIESLCQILFVIATILFTLWELWKIKQMKCEYFSSYWNIAEICIILTSYATIYVFVERYFLTKAAIEVFNNTYGDGYVRLDSAIEKYKVYLYLIAIIVFFSSLKLIKLLQFNKRMNGLALTIRGCWDELSMFFIAFCIVFIAFCTLFYYMFMAAIIDFSSMVLSVETSFSMLLGKFDFDIMYQANSISPIMFFAFSIINTVILINIMLTIIMQAYTEVKKELENLENKYDVIDFVWTSMRQTLRLEKEPDNSVAPKVLGVSLDKGDSDNTSAEELPDKVNQLMQYISDVYFDGRLNLNDQAAVKQIAQGQLPAAAFEPYTSKSLKGGQQFAAFSD